jgi:hypothetical protein|tara:strand:+ start:293 stop:412 length:120 start_codon:yes stop_codon:yes gene_type:complete
MRRGGHREEMVERRALERIEEDGRGCGVVVKMVKLHIEG